MFAENKVAIFVYKLTYQGFTKHYTCTMTEHSDYELIKLMREKDDKQAFELLYNKYWDELYKVALVKLHDDEQAGDIVQDLFVAIWVKRGELNINTNVDLYLFRALKNRITNFYKRKYLAEDKLNQLAKNLPGSTAPEAESNCSYKEVESIINEELERMPDKMKEVFLLSRDEQLSSKKISEMLSLSDQTVRNQISKAIKRIKTTLEKYRITG